MKKARGQHLFLGLTVFISGGAVLILEILGAKLLAPFFGSTQYVWSALIAVTLLALALGYHLGGRVADRVDPFPMLYRVLTLAGWLVLAIPLLRPAVLPLAADMGLKMGSTWGPKLAALAAAQILLAPAMILLGAVAPLAAKHAVSGLDVLGLRVGTLYAISTVGSLAGALAAGFFLVPLLGVGQILFLCSLSLFLPAAAFWTFGSRSREKFLWIALALVGMAAALAGYLNRPRYPLEREGSLWRVLHKAESPYGEVKVVQHAAARILLLNGSLQSSIDMVSRMPLFEYSTATCALLQTAHPAARRVLLVGLGGGIIANWLKATGREVESVEIDGEVIKAAKRFFLADPKLKVTQGDARAFLARRPARRYDAIILDAYTAEAPPTHLLTLEACRLVRENLAPEGIGILNAICQLAGREAFFARSLVATLNRVFPWVEAYAVTMTPGPTNILFVFGQSPRKLSRLAKIPAHPQVAEKIKGLLQRKLSLPGPAMIFTDDFCPVDSLLIESMEYMRAHIRALFPAWVLL